MINETVTPKTPKDKIENLLTYLHSLQIYEGSVVNYPNNEDKQNLAERLLFKNYEEMVFYLFTLLDQGLIEGRDTTSTDGSDLIQIKLTYAGLSKVIELSESEG